MIIDPRELAARLLAASRYAMPIEEARTHIKARRDRLLLREPAAPEPDFTPEPLPVIDDPDAFAAQYWQKRSPKPKAPRRPKLRLVEHSPDGDNDK